MRSSSKGLQFYSYILANDFNNIDNLVGRTILQCRRDGTSITQIYLTQTYIYIYTMTTIPARSTYFLQMAYSRSCKANTGQWIYNPYLLNILLSHFWNCTAILYFNVLLIVYIYILLSCLEAGINKYTDWPEMRNNHHIRFEPNWYTVARLFPSLY